MQQSIEKTKPKSIHKDSACFGEKHLEGDSRYMLNCRLVNFWKRTRNKAAGETPLESEQISNTDLRNYPFK